MERERGESKDKDRDDPRVGESHRGNSFAWLDTSEKYEVPSANWRTLKATLRVKGRSYFAGSGAVLAGFSNSFGSIVGLISIFLYSTRLLSCPFCLFLCV